MKKTALTLAVTVASASAFAAQGLDFSAAQYKRTGHYSPQEPSELALKRDARILEELRAAQGISKPLVATNVQASQTKDRVYTGDVRSERVLTVLVEFPDFKHTDIKEGDTQNYYPVYNPEHYQRIMFSETGYETARGKNVLSVRQYMLDQSGESFSLEGEIYGWYTAKNPAAYYGAEINETIHDSNVAELVKEVLDQVVMDPKFDLAYYDQTDAFDLDNDGIINEPDGVIDHISIIHASIGQEAGGGQLGSDAIWSHRSEIKRGEPVVLADGKTKAFNYMVNPVDGAAGVIAHEFGHDLGLPDEYDWRYTKDEYGSAGSSVGFWSIMSAGSYGGDIPGTEPVGYSPFAKQFLQSTLGGNWFVGSTVAADSLTPQGQTLRLHQASQKGEFNDYIRVDLPEKTFDRFKPLGTHSYYLTPNRYGESIMAEALRLPKIQNAAAYFKVNMDVDAKSEFAAYAITLPDRQFIPLTINVENTQLNPGQEYKLGVYGKTDGWQRAFVDLTALSDKTFYLVFNHLGGLGNQSKGVAMDEYALVVDKQLGFFKDAENGNDLFYSQGVDISQGTQSFAHYYLLEWRQHHGVDKALASTYYGEYHPGLLVWYVDTSYWIDGQLQNDNLVAMHPGEGWLGLVDADQNPIYSTYQFYKKDTMEEYDSYVIPDETRTQMHDAAFNTVPGNVVKLNYMRELDEHWRRISYEDPFVTPNPRFIDWDNYANLVRPATGRDLTPYGLIFEVGNQAKDGSYVDIKVSKHW